MKLTRLKKANDREVEKWLKEKLDLTPYQQEKLRNEEFVRFSPFSFYTVAKNEKPTILWRFTIVLFVVYFLLLILSIPVQWLFTGKWGVSQNFYDNFHSKWCRKIGIHL